MEIGGRCQVTRTGLWFGGEKNKTKWERLSIRPACEAFKEKKCERKLTQVIKTREGAIRYRNIYIYILIIIKDTKNSGRE